MKTYDCPQNNRECYFPYSKHFKYCQECGENHSMKDKIAKLLYSSIGIEVKNEFLLADQILNIPVDDITILTKTGLRNPTLGELVELCKFLINMNKEKYVIGLYGGMEK